MSVEQPRNPLHGITLKVLLEDLVARYGWEELAYRFNLRCFEKEPSIKSSLKFLRKTEWARTRVERLYIDDHRHTMRNKIRNKRRSEQRARRAAAGEETAGEE